MSLTSHDLDQIAKIVNTVVTDGVSGLSTKEDMDRLEGRITTSINLLQRDTFDRLDRHEVRIDRLEKAFQSNSK
jgi:hypothetical protein